MRVRVHPYRPRRRYECNQMQSNATELKVLPLLVTPDEANRGRSEATLAGPFSPWEKVRMRVRAHPYRPRRRYECNQMQSNATELKVLSLLATPSEAQRGHGGLIFSLAARSKQSQTGPNGSKIQTPSAGTHQPPYPSARVRAMLIRTIAVTSERGDGSRCHSD